MPGRRASPRAWLRGKRLEILLQRIDRSTTSQPFPALLCFPSCVPPYPLPTPHARPPPSTPRRCLPRAPLITNQRQKVSFLRLDGNPIGYRGALALARALDAAEGGGARGGGIRRFSYFDLTGSPGSPRPAVTGTASSTTTGSTAGATAGAAASDGASGAATSDAARSDAAGSLTPAEAAYYGGLYARHLEAARAVVESGCGAGPVQGPAQRRDREGAGTGAGTGARRAGRRSATATGETAQDAGAALAPRGRVGFFSPAGFGTARRTEQRHLRRAASHSHGSGGSGGYGGGEDDEDYDEDNSEDSGGCDLWWPSCQLVWAARLAPWSTSGAGCKAVSRRLAAWGVTASGATPSGATVPSASGATPSGAASPLVTTGGAAPSSASPASPGATPGVSPSIPPPAVLSALGNAGASNAGLGAFLAFLEADPVGILARAVRRRDYRRRPSSGKAGDAAAFARSWATAYRGPECADPSLPRPRDPRTARPVW